MRVAASKMKEVEEESVESKRKMTKIQEVYYKSLECKREAPTTTRPAAMNIKKEYRDLSEDDNERDLGNHVLDCGELYNRAIPSR